MPAALLKRDWTQILETGEMECAGCRQVKPVDEMRKRPPLVDGNPRHGPLCIDCGNARARQWFQDNREQGRNTKFRLNLKRNYGMTVEEYDALLEAQRRVCAICGGINPKHGRYGTQFRLAVDHDHETGKVRGLLCNNCNRALGLLSDDVDLLRIATSYLQGGNS